jgi:subtilase family protein
MKHKIVCILLGVAMGWTTTGASTAQDSPVTKEQDIPADPVDPAFRIENRRIGLMEKGRTGCPRVEGWREDLLLRLALGPYQQEIDRELRHKLGRLCVYEGSVPFPESVPGLLKAEPDRMAVTATAPHIPDLGEIGDRSWQILADHFVDQVGQVRLAPTETPRVRLVFIDSHPTGEGPPARPRPDSSWHGYSMAHLAHEVVCGGREPCPIEFATRLALCYDDYSPNPSLRPPGCMGDLGGGRRGLVIDLALAILQEVARWEKSEPEKKLVLNLSVGWDGELGGVSDLSARKKSELELSALAVYEALRHAAHRGVLVIAAAGNRRGGQPDTNWPVLPAAWELRRPTWLPFGLCRKPVYAVGGIDWQGLPLANSRNRGRPRRAAYADHAIVKTVEPATSPVIGPDREGSTMMYTGTSVSAAVASSIAAVLWKLRPELRPAGVMRLMGRSADLLDSRADFYAWRSLSPLLGPPHVKRLSLCQSVLHACGPDGRWCPALEAVHCQLWTHPAANLSSIELTQLTTSFRSPSSPPLSCDSRTRLFIAAARIVSAATGPSAEDFCPMEVLPDIKSPGFLGPQPEENPCPTCTIVPEPPRTSSVAMNSTEYGYALLVYIDPNWQAPAAVGTINSAVLVINCGSGNEPPRSFDISTGIPPPSGSAKLILGSIDGRTSLTGCTASVDFRVTVDGQNRSAQSPVYVDP